LNHESAANPGRGPEVSRVDLLKKSTFRVDGS
jgi:hypothetical protein